MTTPLLPPSPFHLVPTSRLPWQDNKAAQKAKSAVSQEAARMVALKKENPDEFRSKSVGNNDLVKLTTLRGRLKLASQAINKKKTFDEIGFFPKTTKRQWLNPRTWHWVQKIKIALDTGRALNEKKSQKISITSDVLKDYLNLQKRLDYQAYGFKVAPFTRQEALILTKLLQTVGGMSPQEAAQLTRELQKVYQSEGLAQVTQLLGKENEPLAKVQIFLNGMKGGHEIATRFVSLAFEDIDNKIQGVEIWFRLFDAVSGISQSEADSLITQILLQEDVPETKILPFLECLKDENVDTRFDGILDSRMRALCEACDIPPKKLLSAQKKLIESFAFIEHIP